MKHSPEQVKIIEGMLSKLPVFQVCWCLEIQEAWLRCFGAIAEAIEKMGRDDSKPPACGQE